MLSPELAAEISRVKGVKQLGQRSGNWLSAEQSFGVTQALHGRWLNQAEIATSLFSRQCLGHAGSGIELLCGRKRGCRTAEWTVIESQFSGALLASRPAKVWLQNCPVTVLVQRSPASMRNDWYQEQHEENHKQYFRHTGSRNGYTSEP
jgi:hypothetical protein